MQSESERGRGYTRRLDERNLMKTENSIVEIIARISEAWPGRARAAGLQIAIGDDTAVWRPRYGYETILTCDWFLEDSHFLANRHPPHSIGWKCLARAISDIAAMGGEPRCFLLSLALSKKHTGKWLAGFLAGLREAARRLACPIAGGDTTQQRHVLTNVTVIGECERGKAILRSGAGPGDAIFVTGRLGEAEYGLRLVQASRKNVNTADARLQKHLYPMPRCEVGAFLARRRLATAMMDLSDGLSTDLARLCTASEVGARIEQQKLPCVRIAKQDRSKKFDATQLALHGGDDYELLFTVAKKNVMKIPKLIGRIALTQIGEITTQKKVVLADQPGPGRIVKNKGWDPFR